MSDNPINPHPPGSIAAVQYAVRHGLPILAGSDLINHPPHYTQHPSGVECIQITEHMNFCRGNAIKYIWRAGEKGDAIEDLEKARWYIDHEIARLKHNQPGEPNHG